MKILIIRPQPAGDLSHASYSLETPYGLASSSWKRGNGKFRLVVTLPAGTEGEVFVPLHLPARGSKVISGIPDSGTPKVRTSGRPRFTAIEGKHALFRVAQGTYSFTVPLAR